MRQHQIVLLPGDGIGPEITSVTKKLLEAVSQKHGFQLVLQEQLFGGKAIQSEGSPLPPKTLKACQESDAVLLAAIGDPIFDDLPREKRPETGLLELRAGLNLFANLRPVKVWPALVEASSLKPNVIKDVDLLVVRELTGGIYFGQPKGKVFTEDGARAFNTMTYSEKEIERIAKVAFKVAEKRRRKVCSVDKANVLDVSQLWRDQVEVIAKNHQTIELSHLYVDNAAMQLVKEPSQFDVILTSNLFGDILSDEAAMLTGSIGMLPSASLSEKGPGLFEPVHGSAPDIAGMDKANPIAMVLSAAMMLKIGLNEKEAGEALEQAVEKVLNIGYRTCDFREESSTQLGCSQMGSKILEALLDS